MVLVVFAACIMGFLGCRKNQDLAKEPGGITLSAEEIAKNESFIGLNDAISRFDPQYLVRVYKDKRSIKEIVDRSNDLLLQLQTNPESPVFQQQIADFYHFRSVSELKNYSASITENLKVLDKELNFKKTLFVEGGSQLYFKARGLYAKNKLDAYPNNARQTTGLWTEFVDAYFSSFDYNTYVYDESLEAALEGGGGDECNGESCCYERTNCFSQAKIEFWRNVAFYGGSAATSLGSVTAYVGTKIGSLFSPIGAIVGGIAGGLWGGSVGGIAGSTIAYNIYNASLDICKTKYQLCINAKKG